jgi:hypothetical protein
MAIRVTRNEAGNCVTFIGSTNPVYWNSCLSAQINADNDNNIDVINDIRSEESGTTIYEFYNLPFTDFQDADGNDFDSPSAAAAYITAEANVATNTGTFTLNQEDALDFYRDATNTTVLFGNGDIYAVNSIVAVENADGTINIQTARSNKVLYAGLRYYNTTASDGAITFNNVTTAVNTLNEVFSGTTIGTGGGTGPSTFITNSGLTAFTVYGDRISESGTAGYTSTADVTNGVTNFDTSNGIYSNQLISQPGEFFEFDNGGDWTSTQGLTFGLFDETTYDANSADLQTDVAGNAIKMALSLRVKNSPFGFTDPDAAHSKVNESGISNDPGTKSVFRVGLDQDNRGYIAHQLADGSFETIVRTDVALASGTDFRFVMVMPLANSIEGIRSMTTNLLDTTSALNWYYIESPDTNFYYPLFQTEAEAIAVDEAYGTATIGNGAAHQHTFVDELPTSQIWYMPSTYMFHNQSVAPTPPANVTYNVIVTGADSNYVPSPFSGSDITVNEGDSVNLQVVPAGNANTFAVSGLPTGLAFNGSNIVGTAPGVGGFTSTNPSDTYTITVTIANSYGGSTGSFDLIVNNTSVPAVAISGWTHITGSTALIDSDTLDDQSAVTLDDVVQDGYRFKMTDAYVTANILPALQATGDKVYVGFSPTPTTGWGGATVGDFNCGFRFQYNSANSVQVQAMLGGTSMGSAVVHTYSTNIGKDFYISNDGGVLEANYHSSSQSKDLEPTAANGGTWDYTETQDTGITGDKVIVIATNGTSADISTTGISEHALPAAVTILTSWNKALDFSGGNEYAKQVSNSYLGNPLSMGFTGITVPAHNSFPNKTSNHTYSRPWATAIVFKIDGNNSNQHIWNYGEGASSGNDNIYVRLSASKNLYFGWGREGTGVNECQIVSGGTLATNQWYGLYIAHKGTRLNASNATAANLGNAFDIRLMSSIDSFNAVGSNLSSSTTWLNTGDRMDRAFGGNLTIGGRSSNRNFHGKVASMVVTTLLTDTNMPSDAEIQTMITDPVKWLSDYKVGTSYRAPNMQNAQYIFTANGSNEGRATQVWLMGDGTSDSYANGMRNYVYPADQNYTKLQLNSMQSNDIETVNINGLT